MLFKEQIFWLFWVQFLFLLQTLGVDVENNFRVPYVPAGRRVK